MTTSSDHAIAVIGVGLRLPGAGTLAELERNLERGRDCVRRPGRERLVNASADPDADHRRMGCLERIDLFDHRLFGISLREAELMDPNQRLALQLAHTAIEHAGYAPRALRGSRTAVVLGGARSDYAGLIVEPDPLQVLGSTPAAIAARVSYHLDLRGLSTVVDTACSSGLVAVVLAMRELREGTADLALAGGVSVAAVLRAEHRGPELFEITSPEGVCRPFDARANGTVAGEGGAVVLLKPLARALEDGDPVHAVLRGGAAGHNGFGAASMGAPSQRALADVLGEAWRDAGVPPASIGYVECHGSGTRLGDAVEVEALRQACAEAGVPARTVAIGSIKGSIGHLNHAAGAAGLLKALLAIRGGRLHPLPRFSAPNPELDLTGPVYVEPAGGPWAGGDGPRRAGVTALGLTGTNAHVVLEEPPPRPAPRRASPPLPWTVATLSARSTGSLRRLRAAHADFVAGAGHGLAEIAQLMNRGRDDHPHRLAWAVASRAELLDALRTEQADPAPVPDGPRVVVLCSGDGEVDDGRWRAWTAGHPALAAIAAELPPAVGPAARLVARQYALATLLDRLGVGDVRLVGSGPGNLAVRALRGELTIAGALGLAGEASVTDAVDETRLVQAANAFLREPSVLVELAPDGVLGRAFATAVPGLRPLSLTADADPRGAAELLARLYRLGVNVYWERHYAGQPAARFEAPTYPFEETRCWCRPAGAVAVAGAGSTDAEAAGAPAAGWTATERALAGIWRDVLKEPSVEPAANYFHLGGTSIAAQMVIARARRELGVAITFRDVFAHPTLRALAARVDELRAAGPERPAAGEEIPRAPRDRPLPLTYGQEQLWFLDRLHPGSPLYNIPTDLHLRGPLDVEALRAALRTLAERHEILRTSIHEREGEPRMLVDCDPPELPVTDLSWLPAAERDREVRRLIGREAGLPFALDRGPLLRAALLRLGPAEHVLLLTYHHIVFDGWTPAVVHRELAAAYRAHRAGRAPDLPPLPIQYGDFAAWQRTALRGERLDGGLRFWRRYLDGYAPFEPPLDRPRPSRQSYRGAMFEFILDPEVGEGVRALAAASGVSTFVAMFGLVGALVAGWAGAEDVAIGVATSGRYHPATAGLIGYFNNVVPFRLRVRPDLTTRQLVAHSAHRVAEVLDHEEVPFERIVEDWQGRRSADRHPIYTVAYTHQNAPNSPLDLGDVAVSRYLNAVISGVAPGTAKFDLTLAVVDQNRGPMACAIEYATDLFERSSVEALAERWRELLRRATADPDRPLLPAAVRGARP